MKQLYIDFDGVILDTMTKSYEELKKENIDRKDQDKVMEFFRNLDWKKLIEETEEINDSINEIKKICDSKKFNVYILTHVNSTNEMIEKIKTLKSNMDYGIFKPIQYAAIEALKNGKESIETKEDE